MSTTNIDNSENKEYIYQRKPQKLDSDSSDDKFDVFVPKRNMIIILAIFGALFAAQFYYFSGMYYAALFPNRPYIASEYYWWVPFVFLGLAFVIIIAWANIGSRFASYSIVKYLKKTTTKEHLKPVEIVLGYPMRTKDVYYLEAYPDDLDLGSSVQDLKILIKRVLEVLFLSMGMSVMIASTAAPYIWAKVYLWNPDYYINMEEMIIDMTIYLGPLTLLILMLVMPVFWIAEDVQAYRITPSQDAVRIGLFMRSGLLSKILSFFGLVLVYNLAQEFATALLGGGGSTSELMSHPDKAIAVYTNTFLWFGLILAMSAAIPFLVAFVYLGFFHERWVNNVRVHASQFMPVGTMNIRKPDMSRMQYLNKPEMVDETGGFFQTPHGRIVLLVSIIATAVICIYLAFILGFEEAFLA